MSDRQVESSPVSADGVITYCIVPPGQEQLGTLLRRYYSGDPLLEVRVERRVAERRRPGDRREASSTDLPADRRRIRNPGGRRLGDRRAETVSVPTLPLPLLVRRRSEQVAFVTRIEPSSRQLRDLDAGRLAISFQAGEEGALDELYRLFYDQIHAYARMTLRDRAEAEDVVQQTFVNAIGALPDFELRAGGESVRAWLFQIARNVAHDLRRAKGRTFVERPADIDRRRDVPIEDFPEALQWIHDVDLAIFVRRLPPAQAELLTLRYKLDMGLDQIAHVVGSNPAAVRRMHARALKTLKLHLASVSRRPTRSRRAWSRVRPKTNPVLASRRFALARPCTPTAGLSLASRRLP